MINIIELENKELYFSKLRLFFTDSLGLRYSTDWQSTDILIFYVFLLDTEKEYIFTFYNNIDDVINTFIRIAIIEYENSYSNEFNRFELYKLNIDSISSDLIVNEPIDIVNMFFNKFNKYEDI
jgi:hypothetical protein